MNLDDLFPQLDVDVVTPLDLLDQVSGHAVVQRAAHQHRDLVRVLRQKDGSLARRVGSTNHEDVLALVADRLGPCGAVVDAGPRQSLDPGHIELADGDAGRDDECLACQLGSIGECHHAIRVAEADAHDLLG